MPRPPADKQPSLEDWWSDPAPPAPVRPRLPKKAPATVTQSEPEQLDLFSIAPDDATTTSSAATATPAAGPAPDSTGMTPPDSTGMTLPLDLTEMVAVAPPAATARVEASQFTVDENTQVAPSGVKARMEANLAALRTLRQVQSEGRPATEREQATLARWGGWGAQGLSQIFDEDRDEHAPMRAQLAELLSEDEYAAARRTTINAHYTDPGIVTGVWSALQGLGFTGGRVLEPGCGSGTFIGAAPATAEMVGIELDPVTAGIAALLYPNATVRAESFADSRFPEGHFDAVVGNVPFSDVVLHDPRHNAAALSMHNHFIVKSLELTRPGGVVAVLTSRYTMDAADPTARRAMWERADLIAAVRLPTGAHRRVAGTEAVTDLLMLRRREGAPLRDEPAWVRTLTVDLPTKDGEESARINQYWLDHPEHVLGQQRLDVGLHGVFSLEVQGEPNAVPAHLREVLTGVTTHAAAAGLGWEPRTEEQRQEAAAYEPAPEGALDGLLIHRGGGEFARVDVGRLVPAKVFKTAADEVVALITLRDEARELIAMESSTLETTPEMDALRASLAAHWQSYVDKYGPINRAVVTTAMTTDEHGQKVPQLDDDGDPIIRRRTPHAVTRFRKDPYGPLLWGLELYDDITQEARPSTLLRERVVVPRTPVTHVDDVLDALTVVMDTHGRVDLPEIARLTGRDQEAVIDGLGEAIYCDPTTQTWVTQSEYCSGNVRAKLNEARAAAANDPQWSRNVGALAAVLPPDIQPGAITPRIGAAWIPDSDHQQFLRDILGEESVRITNVPGVGWTVEGGTWSLRATSEWGTQRMPAGKLMKRLLEQEPIIIVDAVEPGSSQTITNPVETDAAVEKGNLLQERFQDWLWEDPARTARLVEDYNRRFNSVVLRDYTAEGAALTLPGLVKSWTPHPHQRTAVARMLHSPSVGLFHEVGAGKTAEMVIGAMELKRLGMITKPAVVVPNHMLEQFAREWAQLYPQARVLAAGSDDLTGENRRAFVAKAAANNWDAVILTRTAFKNLPLLPQNEAEFRKRETAEVRERLDQLKEIGTSASIKAQERRVLAQEEKLKQQRDKAVDPAMCFEQTGIDYLIVDELHDYKNLRTESAIPGAAISGSQRSMDLYAKIEWLRQTHGKRVITGATATPIANSITEMYVMQKYLNPAALSATGLHNFDSWAATFGEVVTDFEVNAEGKLKVKARFARFNNLPELRVMFAEFADIKTTADLDYIKRPEIVARPDGRRDPRLIVIPPSPELQDYLATISERVELISSRSVDASEDNMLTVCNDGRKAALDLRLIDEAYGDVDGSKINTAADELHRVWMQTRDNIYLDDDGTPSATPGALQIVFCDLGTPSARWNVYQELKEQLIARGMPRAQIKFVHDAVTDDEKGKLFAACRSGTVSVLMGSTAKMGVGTNIQARAVHLMDLDAPWRPADVTQRHGRILRQGNQNAEVAITQVVTQGSFDTFMWQTLERKARFIDQVMTGNDLGRHLDGDIGGTAVNYAEAKAILSGNPLLLEEATAKRDLVRLGRLERSHAQSQRSLEYQREAAQATLTQAERSIPALIEAQQRTVPTEGDQFRLVTPRGGVYTKRADVVGHLRQLVLGWGDFPREVGTLGGHPIQMLSRGQQIDHQIPVRWGVTDLPGVTINTLIPTDGPGIGLVTRLENMVQNGIPAQVERLTNSAQEAQLTLINAESLIGLPFRNADELTSAQKRYDEVRQQIAAQQHQEALDARTQDQAPADPTTAQDSTLRRLLAKDLEGALPTVDNPRPSARGLDR